MKTISSFITTLLISACVACGTSDAQKPLEPKLIGPPPAVDKELRPYVDMFIRDCEARRKDCQERLSKILEIRVVNMPNFSKKDDEIVIGLCYDGFLIKRIEINKQIMSYHGRYLQTLVYHELGHCMYDLEHEQRTDMIMSPAMPEITILMQYWNDMLAEFFSAIEEQHGP